MRLVQYCLTFRTNTISKFINQKLTVMTLSKSNYRDSIKKMTKEGILIILVVKPAKGKSAKKKAAPKAKAKSKPVATKKKKVVKYKAKAKPAKKVVATNPKPKLIAKKKKASVNPKAKANVKNKITPVKPKAKTKVVKKATAPVKQKAKAVTAKRPSSQTKPVTKMKAVKESTTSAKQKTTAVITKNLIKPRKGEEKLTDLKTKIAVETTVNPSIHSEGEELHTLPEHDGITHPVTPFEQHKKENIFHSKEEASLHQFNQKIKNAQPSRKTMKVFNMKRGL